MSENSSQPSPNSESPWGDDDDLTADLDLGFDGAEDILRTWRRGMRPDPDLTVSQWADQHRWLSSRASAEPGRYRTARTPYLREIMTRALRPGGLFLFDTINRNPMARLATITVAEDLLRLLPRGTHDPAKFIKPAELRAVLQGAGLEPGAFTGLGPRGVNRRLDLTFGPLPLTAILYMGTARKPAVEAPK